MEPKEVYSAPYAKATYLSEYKAIMVVWSGIHTIDEYKKTMTACIEFQKNSGFPVLNYVSDIRNQGIVNPESRKWFEKVALPKAIEQGLKRAAVIFDGNVFKKYYLNMILQVANVYHLPLKFFNTAEEAMGWFKSFEQ